ncbi:MAG: DUF151 domain-containing protein [Caldisphaeraceae archaeon]|nr:DUF151 domain-containing protein [Caldisphaeraceae archaeon]
MDNLLRVTNVQAYYKVIQDVESGFGTYIIGLALSLEDGRIFSLVNIPPDIAEAIRIFNDGEIPPRRQSIFSFLMNHEEFKYLLGKTLKRIVIDELDMNNGLYTASVDFEAEGLNLSIKMIPSHAIYLAMISGKPIYVTKRLADMEEQNSERED